MTPQELPGYLRAVRARIEAAAVPVCDAIGETYKEHLVGFTLHESGSHPPVTQTPAAPGRPPAFMTGGLADSVTKTAATGGGGVAECSVAPHVIYAATQEYGGDHHGNPLMWLWVRYVGPAEVKRRRWDKEIVHIPARPYMSTAVAEEIGNGELTKAAMESFEAAAWG